MTAARVATIEQVLRAALDPSQIEVIDDSARHAGHEGARDGRGHFRVLVRSARFQGLKPIARHRLVYEAMGELMQTDVHALQIRALAPDDKE